MFILSGNRHLPIGKYSKVFCHVESFLHILRKYQFYSNILQREEQKVKLLITLLLRKLPNTIKGTSKGLEALPSNMNYYYIKLTRGY